MLALIARDNKSHNSSNPRKLQTNMRSGASMVPFLFALLAVFIGLNEAYPSGAPQRACLTMIPGHRDTQVQKGKAPFKILVTPAPDGLFDVTLKGEKGPFKGFLVNAVVYNSSVSAKDLPLKSITGQFIGLDSSNTAKGVPCANTDDTATHSSSKIKFEQQLKWRPSTSASEEQVQFRATFVVEYPTYYVGVTSEPMTISP